MDIEERVDKLESRVQTIESNVTDIKADVKINTNTTNQILEIVKKLENSIEKLKADNIDNKNVVVKDKAQNWDKVIFAILGGIGAYLLSLVLK